MNSPYPQIPCTRCGQPIDTDQGRVLCVDCAGTDRPTSTLDLLVREALTNRLVAFVHDELEMLNGTPFHPASSVYDLTVRELLAEYKAHPAR